LGVIAVGTKERKRFAPGELSYLVNMANLLGMTLENVRLFEQVATVRRQWEYTFDSIGDPILVHDGQGRILRSNQRLRHLLGREREAMVGWSVTELLSTKNAAYKVCPYCEGVAGEGDNPDPWLQGYFLASNSRFADPSGRETSSLHCSSADFFCANADNGADFFGTGSCRGYNGSPSRDVVDVLLHLPQRTRQDRRSRLGRSGPPGSGG
jgi:hypothetical protein